MRKKYSFTSTRVVPVRTQGSRYGIDYTLLDARYRDELLNNHFEGWTPPELMGMMVLVDDRYSLVDERVMVDETSGEVMPLADARERMLSVPWRCAVCRKGIRAKLGSIKRENLICPECLKWSVDRRITSEDPIIQDSVLFTETCKKIIREKREYIVKQIRRSAGNKNRPRKNEASPRAQRLSPGSRGEDGRSAR